MATIALVFGWLLPAAAQTSPLPRPVSPTVKGYLSVSGTYQFNVNDFQDSANFRENAEGGQFRAAYSLERGPAFDIAGGAVVWRHLGVGAGVSRYTRTTAVTVTGSIPHPFFFNRARSIDGSVSNLSREELAVHVQVGGVFFAGERLLVRVFGGPSFFQVTQGIVTDFSYDDSYPYDTASFQSAATTTATESKLAFNVGGDVAFFFTRQVGVGFTARFSGTNLDLPSASGGTVQVRAGGMQAGGGLRLRF